MWRPIPWSWTCPFNCYFISALLPLIPTSISSRKESTDWLSRGIFLHSLDPAPQKQYPLTNFIVLIIGIFIIVLSNQTIQMFFIHDFNALAIAWSSEDKRELQSLWNFLASISRQNWESAISSPFRSNVFYLWVPLALQMASAHPASTDICRNICWNR